MERLLVNNFVKIKKNNYNDPILGILHNRGYAIIQFRAEAAAQEAIQKENDTELCNKRIIVRTVVDKETQPNAVHPRPSTSDTSKKLTDINHPIFPVVYTSQRTLVRNDIEIIAMSEDLLPFAENIEGALRNLGINVDILYPNANASIDKILEKIKSDGTMLALLMKPENIQLGTITVCFLHYHTPDQDMPVKSALEMIERIFEKR